MPPTVSLKDIQSAIDNTYRGEDLDFVDIELLLETNGSTISCSEY